MSSNLLNHQGTKAPRNANAGGTTDEHGCTQMDAVILVHLRLSVVEFCSAFSWRLGGLVVQSNFKAAA